MKQGIIVLLFCLFSAAFSAQPALAAVGCDLNDPDRDVSRLFPGSTGYKTYYMAIDKQGGAPMLKRVEQRLGDAFQGLYETIDVPYTVYEILKGTEKIGYIHGVNQKGHYGGIQVFLVLDLDGTIRNFYLQKLTSKAAARFRSPEFGMQFEKLSLADFDAYDVTTGKAAVPGRVDQIQNPAPEAGDDFRAVLRAAKKNLILMDEFVFGNRYLNSRVGDGTAR